MPDRRRFSPKRLSRRGRYHHPGRFFMAAQRSVIAVVDDDSELRSALGDLLSMFGYGIELFASGVEFLAAARTTEAACLVTDIELGDISGVELARQLAALGYEFPVIFMTGSRDDTFWRQANELGCVAYLNKPFPARQLIDAIKEAMAGVRMPCLSGCP
jgi:FixJ family two-component response regulator